MEDETCFMIIDSGIKTMSIPQVERLKKMCENEIAKRQKEVLV